MSIFEFDPTLYSVSTEDERRFRIDRIRALRARLWLYANGFKDEAKLENELDVFRAEFERKIELSKAVWAKSLERAVMFNSRSFLGPFIGSYSNCAIVVSEG